MSTVTDFITRVRRRLEDPNSLHWPDTEIIGAINEAKNDLFDHIYLRNRDCLEAIQTEYSWPSNEMSVSLETIAPALDVGSYEVLLVSTTPTTESTTVDNRPVPMRRVNFEELYRRNISDPIFYDSLIDESGNAETWQGGRPSRESSMTWAQQGFTMYVDPIPRRAVKLRLEILLRFKEFDEAGNENAMQVLPGTEVIFRRWERLLEYFTVAILKGRSDEASDPVFMQMQSKMSLLNGWLDTRSRAGVLRITTDAY